MKFSLQEKGSGNTVPENQSFEETTSSSEMGGINAKEVSSSEELFTGTEIQDDLPQKVAQLQKEKRKKQQKRLAEQAKYIVAAAVVGFTSAVTVGVIDLTRVNLTLHAQTVGMNYVECLLKIENASDAPLHLTFTHAGEAQKSERIAEDVTEYVFTCKGLLPETQYVLNVFDEDGKDVFTHSFITDPFVTFTADPTDEGILHFSLHESFMTTEMDVGISLISPLGAYVDAFSSGEIFSQGIIYLDALFYGEHTFELKLFIPPEADENGEIPVDGDWEEFQYQKKLTVGNLQPLKYNVTSDGTTLHFEYLSGNADGYGSAEIRLYQNEEFVGSFTSDVYDGESFEGALDGGLSGEFEIIMTAEFEIDGHAFYNELWKGSVTLGI